MNKEEENRNLQETIRLAKELLELADQGDSQRNDIGCGVLYGTVRDCAYKIRSLALNELEAHHVRPLSAGKTG
ncbi:MAG: hypothetical protein JW709_00805 [Sedimentisphaerales bacterium]|nr:hypothetical protein [Sedimentisphaerales bacterium]